MKTKSKLFTMQLQPELHKFLSAESQRTNRSMKQLLVDLIMKHKHLTEDHK